MGKTEWDMQEVKYLKKINLVQTNVILLVCFVLYSSFVAYAGDTLVIFTTVCAFCWILTVLDVTP
ncbi:hypothetical protein MUN88_06640 [Gracilibacillus caseinilyticus]|uniref:Uncharacterized protein n=1 Tax=Gracilibacillus caseinilyticus TaxID=2932256 RepID=A0ABY4F5L2_9BACI|nr:hypothetical protein [Gracilibacillus caseinilyticus]UOQ49751.1 hypothetical protein MUN88_06640 [Gracilibacillus caseinilyticus]